MRLLAIAAVAVVVTAVFNTNPRPGVRADHLAVTVAVVLFAAGTVAVVRAHDASPTVLLPLMAMVVIAAAALVGFQPRGPGFLGVFPAVSAAALRLPTRAATVVAGAA